MHDKELILEILKQIFDSTQVINKILKEVQDEK